MRQAIQETKVHELGTNHNSNMANLNGLDEIDQWAMRVGNAEKTKKEITPAKRHVACS